MYYSSLVLAIIGLAVVLALFQSALAASAALFLGFATLATAGLIADAWRGLPAMARSTGLTRPERLVIVWGLVATAAASLMIFVEAAAGLDGGSSWVFAVALASGTGLFAAASLIRY